MEAKKHERNVGPKWFIIVTQSVILPTKDGLRSLSKGKLKDFFAEPEATDSAGLRCQE